MILSQSTTWLSAIPRGADVARAKTVARPTVAGADAPLNLDMIPIVTTDAILDESTRQGFWVQTS